MAQYSTFTDDHTLEEQLKALEDDELLDFWEETQHLARMFRGEEEFSSEHADPVYDPEYERLIVQELQVRRCRRETGREG